MAAGRAGFFFLSRCELATRVSKLALAGVGGDAIVGDVPHSISVDTCGGGDLRVGTVFTAGGRVGAPRGDPAEVFASDCSSRHRFTYRATEGSCSSALDGGCFLRGGLAPIAGERVGCRLLLQHLGLLQGESARTASAQRSR